MTIRAHPILAALLLALLCLTGCSEDDDVTPIDMTLDESWPNEDGRWWRYDLRISHSATELTNLTDPDTPLPSLSALRQIMLNVDHTEEVETHDRVLDAVFDGDIVTQSGATGQNLVVTSTPAGGAPAASAGETFLSALRRARPDLRDRLPAAGKAYEERTPYGLTGPCWEKTDTHIGGYGDLHAELSWLYLETPLDRNATFDLQLVPQIADDIWLHGWIVRQGEWTQEGETFTRALEVFTLIDFGVQTITGDDGMPAGEIRSLACFGTIYAPGVGPVYIKEWRVLPGDPVLQDRPGELVVLEAVLVDRGLPEDPH